MVLAFSGRQSSEITITALGWRGLGRIMADSLKGGIAMVNFYDKLAEMETRTMLQEEVSDIRRNVLWFDGTWRGESFDQKLAWRGGVPAKAATWIQACTAGFIRYKEIARALELWALFTVWKVWGACRDKWVGWRRRRGLEEPTPELKLRNCDTPSRMELLGSVRGRKMELLRSLRETDPEAAPARALPPGLVFGEIKMALSQSAQIWRDAKQGTRWPPA